MRVDSQFFISIAISMKEPDHRVGNCLLEMVSYFIFISASCKTLPGKGPGVPFKKSNVLTQTQLH